MGKMGNNHNSRIGHDFEKKVRKAFERNGYFLVKQNDWRRNYEPDHDHAYKREFDLVMFRDDRFYIIECKAHLRSSAMVGMGLVSEFYQKLSNYNGRAAEKMMVTDTGYTARAREYAGERSICLINGQGLAAMENAGYKSNLGSMIAGSAIMSTLEILPGKLAGYIKTR
jgi:hypothetical protein